MLLLALEKAGCLLSHDIPQQLSPAQTLTAAAASSTPAAAAASWGTQTAGCRWLRQGSWGGQAVVAVEPTNTRGLGSVQQLP